MRIYVDADACPVVKETEQVAKKARQSKKKVHLKGPDKRTRADNEKFADGLARLLEMSRNNDGLV